MKHFSFYLAVILTNLFAFSTIWFILYHENISNWFVIIPSLILTFPKFKK